MIRTLPSERQDWAVPADPMGDPELVSDPTADVDHRWGLGSADPEYPTHADRRAPGPRPCYHPLSCSACANRGEPCGTHHAGEPGHD